MADDTSPTPTETGRSRRTRLALGRLLVGMGVLHVVAPKPFEAIVPDYLGHERELNLLSAAVEAAAGVLLLQSDPRRHRLGGAIAAATFIAVYPANIDMAVRAVQDKGATSAFAIGTLLRLPLQLPLIAWALKIARKDHAQR